METTEKIEKCCMKWLRAQWKFNDEFLELATETLKHFSPTTLEAGTKAAITKAGRYKPTIADIVAACESVGQGRETATPRTQNVEHGINRTKGDAAMHTHLGQMGLQEGWGISLWMDAATGKKYRTAAEYRNGMWEAQEAEKSLNAWPDGKVKQSLLSLRNTMLAREVELRQKFLRGAA